MDETGRHDTIRPGERQVHVPPRCDAALRFIGRCRTPFATRADCPRQGRQDGPDCALEFDPPWDAALDGIEAFEHADVLYWLDRARRDLVTQSKGGTAVPVGTFALRSPVRPNPIGLSRVRLIRREGARLIVRGLDCIDGTPLVDLKPETCHHSAPGTPAR
ncbi:tRNA (N6-threonylcarbamoyladenosine(37)-N6)-methyltransferase TrmO [Roseivivax isoporae]|uniref:VirR n=1 Tax=Roseivivax isoporae LMG 25204 TaxID=1449351 RepID=X7FDM9_9RHOB|nr:tRNA (N6-threonylcarbamoyladenosine(37)-N6)-methyltransferase TrmO [Roseivivax isoporae]ETX30181.1 virR [Roseivivax isoporae LMG 25204]